ncbi:PliI family lysozyme inhibitor of I-type lysozyme [Shewanella intestini]|uniref:Lipoprotein n=1 Tax=Shewanella intestini TaxID=2017544 RepID=A0ABS5I1Y4_9GAMM|nr:MULTISPECIES: PliI family lysozyme inhibitor of I-type lysozyme [Shewanella]MBR9727420.1 hypothetical protein [Shewanella intestini]MRG35530.1 hypothetical protein [Shewanella sp. XMDDZSB0408]
MNKIIITVAVLLAVSGCSINVNKSATDSDAANISQSTTDAGFIQSISLANGATLVVEEGRLEPRSIGSVSVKLYKDLNVGDFSDAVNFVRDGTILKAVLIENGSDTQKLSITTVTAGSGNYQASQLVCVKDNKLNLC